MVLPHLHWIYMCIILYYFCISLPLVGPGDVLLFFRVNMSMEISIYPYNIQSEPRLRIPGWCMNPNPNLKNVPVVMDEFPWGWKFGVPWNWMPEYRFQVFDFSFDSTVFQNIHMRKISHQNFWFRWNWNRACSISKKWNPTLLLWLQHQTMSLYTLTLPLLILHSLTHQTASSNSAGK